MAAPPLPVPAELPPPPPEGASPASPDPTRTEAVGPREATARAIAVGCGIGVVLAAGNVYTGLKTAFIDGGSITAALLGFTFFTTFRNLARKPYSALENNVTQTTAASAAIGGKSARRLIRSRSSGASSPRGSAETSASPAFRRIAAIRACAYWT